MKQEDYKVIHIMQDGTIREAIEGYKVPINDRTKLFYRLLASTPLKEKTA